METNFQLLMLSPNIQSFHFSGGRGGRGAHGNQFPTFDAEFKFAKIQSSHLGGGARGNQFTTFDAESKFAEIQSSHFQLGGVGGGRLVEPISNF